jgi:hypothetical protein
MVADLNAVLCVVRPLLLGLSKVFKNIVCSRIVGLAIPSKAGKSVLSDGISSHDNWLVLDVERLIELSMSAEEAERLKHIKGTSSYQIHAYPIYKKYYLDILKAHPRKNIICLVSDLRLLEYLGIKKTYTFVPDNKLADAMVKAMGDEDAKLFTDSRLDLLANTHNYITYKGFDDLATLIVDKFKLRTKL